ERDRARTSFHGGPLPAQAQVGHVAWGRRGCDRPGGNDRDALEDGLVGGELVDDLLTQRRLVSLADALEVAERAIEAHPAVNHPGTALGEGHQVDLIDAVSLVLPSERPARRTPLVTQPP